MDVGVRELERGRRQRRGTIAERRSEQQDGLVIRGGRPWSDGHHPSRGVVLASASGWTGPPPDERMSQPA
jgi:hypothetical protein